MQCDCLSVILFRRVVVSLSLTSLRGTCRVSSGRKDFQITEEKRFLQACFCQFYHWFAWIIFSNDHNHTVLNKSPTEQVASYEVVLQMETPGNATRGQIFTNLRRSMLAQEWHHLTCGLSN